MNAILKWYLRVMLSRPIIRAVDWTPEERNAFDHFCRSSCGLKLFEFLRQVVANVTFNAVYSTDVSQNAKARGMQDMLAILYRLRVFPEAQQEESSSGSLEEGESVRGRAGPPDDWRWLGGRGAIG